MATSHAIADLESKESYADRSVACDREVSDQYRSAAFPKTFWRACMERTEAPEHAAARKAAESKAINDEYDRAIADANQKIAAEKRQQATRSAWAKRPSGVSIGMTKAQVLATKWGKPERTNSTITRAGEREQWVYPGMQFLYFENGILTSIQQSR